MKKITNLINLKKRESERKKTKIKIMETIKTLILMVKLEIISTHIIDTLFFAFYVRVNILLSKIFLNKNCENLH